MGMGTASAAACRQHWRKQAAGTPRLLLAAAWRPCAGEPLLIPPALFPPCQPACQADLDLGNYERFLDLALSKDNNLTTGKVYQARRWPSPGIGLRLAAHESREVEEGPGRRPAGALATARLSKAEPHSRRSRLLATQPACLHVHVRCRGQAVRGMLLPALTPDGTPRPRNFSLSSSASAGETTWARPCRCGARAGQLQHRQHQHVRR